MTTEFCSRALIAGAMLTLMPAGAAFADATETTTMSATAIIGQACVVSSGTAAVDFGSLAMVDAAEPSAVVPTSVATGQNFSAMCVAGTSTPTFSYTSLNGLGAAFRLKSAAGIYIAYQLWMDGGAVLVNGPTTLTAHPGFAADGTVKNLGLIAKIIASEKLGKPAGVYDDTVTITAHWTP